MIRETKIFIKSKEKRGTVILKIKKKIKNGIVHWLNILPLHPETPSKWKQRNKTGKKLLEEKQFQKNSKKMQSDEWELKDEEKQKKLAQLPDSG